MSAKVVGSVVSLVDDDDPSICQHVVLAQCPICESAVVSSHVTHQWGDWATGDYTTSRPVRLWPLPRRSLSDDAPSGVRRDFDEAQRCLSVEAHTAAAMLARRVLEGVAVDLGATAFHLRRKLQELKRSGVIDGRLAEWAQALSVVGNDAAQKVSSVVSSDDANDALAFAEALADYVYTFQKRYELFVARRKSVRGSADLGG